MVKVMVYDTGRGYVVFKNQDGKILQRPRVKEGLKFDTGTTNALAFSTSIDPETFPAMLQGLGALLVENF